MISAAHRTHPMSTAWRSVQRAIVRYALAARRGRRAAWSSRARSRWRRIAPPGSSRNGSRGPRAAWTVRSCFRSRTYLFARGESYAAHYRPEAFVCLSESIDLHRVDPGAITVPMTLVAVQEDQLVPVSDVRELRDRLAGSCRLVEISSLFGHDAFLKETAVLRDVFAQALE